MRFCVLGPLEAYANGHRVAIGGGRERALLALLLVHSGQIVSRDRLIDELWGGEPPSSGSQSLDVYLSRLRKAFREAGASNVLATRSPGYVLYADETDARRFEILAGEGRDALAAGDAGRAAERLMQALARWRGAAYLEVADEPWARAEAGRLEELRLAATEDRIDAELSLGHHATLVGELEQLVARHRTRERLVGQLMLALYRSERQADALAAYRAARRSLVEDLGLEPGPELRRLEAAVLAQDPALDLPPKSGERPSAEASPTRRRRLAGALAATALLAGALIIVLVVVGQGTASRRAIASNSAGPLDLETGQVGTSVAVGSAPAGIATGAGSVWVTNGADGTVTRIDPRGNHVEQTIVVGSSPAGIAYGGGAIWVTNALDGSVSRIDPRTNQVVQTISVGGRPIAVAADASAVWVANADGDTVIPLDPRSGVPRRPVRLDASPGGVAVAFGALWATEPLAHKLLRIDPSSREVLAEIGVGAGAGPVATEPAACGWSTLSTGRCRGSTRSATRSPRPSRSGMRQAQKRLMPAGLGQRPRRRSCGVGGSQTGAVTGRYTVGAAPAAVDAFRRTLWVAAGAPIGRAHRGGTLRVEYSKIGELDPAFASERPRDLARDRGRTRGAHRRCWSGAALSPPRDRGADTDRRRAHIRLPRPSRKTRYVGGRPRQSVRSTARVRAVIRDQQPGRRHLRGSGWERRRASVDRSPGTSRPESSPTTEQTRSPWTSPTQTRTCCSSQALPAARPAPPGTPRRHIATAPIPSTGPYRVARFVSGRRFAARAQRALPRVVPGRPTRRLPRPDRHPDGR